MIIDGNIIDSSFYQKENRCAYTVSRETKMVWAVQLDLLMQLDKMCKLHNLKYCVGAGTLLGAVRHKGFIPWDDDIDVYMLREDFDRLTAVADEFQPPYFLQNSHTEPNLLRTYSRLRNGETTGTTAVDADRDINRGIFIDIFPIDGISDDRFKNGIQKARNALYIRIFNCYNASKISSGFEKLCFKRKVQFILGKLFVRNKESILKRYERNITKYSNGSSALWGNRTIVFDCPKSRRPLKDYQDLIDMPFEMLTVPVPRSYDSMLRQQYGDYMKIPKDKGKNMHGELIISTDYAYDDPRRLSE